MSSGETPTTSSHQEELAEEDVEEGVVSAGGFGVYAAREIGITYSQAPSGQWDVKRAQHDLKASGIVYQQQQDALEAEFARDQQAKDRSQKRFLERVAFVAAMIILVGTLACGLYLLLGRHDDISNQAGLAIVSVVLGGIAGGVGGYVAGVNK